MKCYIDMDGVLCRFHQRAVEIHDLLDPYFLEDNLGKWGLPELIGMSLSKFFKPFETSFYANLNPTEECHEIIKACEDKFGQENCSILTSLTMNDGCYNGKRQWVKKHLDEHYFTRVGCIKDKSVYADKNTVLIDDKDSNIDNFRKAGGHTFLVGRPWNCCHEFELDNVSDLELELSLI